MIIQFVCRGNTFRSRLAEAYFNSLDIVGWKAISSGVEATKNLNGVICWYTKEILEENNFYSSDKNHWTQISKEKLDSSDFIVFIDKSCFDDCLTYYGDTFLSKPYKIWSIKDMPNLLDEEKIKKEKVLVLNTANEIFETIKNDVKNLVLP